MTGDSSILLALGWLLFLALSGVILVAVSAREEKGRKRLRVGDKAPPELLNRSPDAGPIGGFVEVCPECQRINSIFHP